MVPFLYTWHCKHSHATIPPHETFLVLDILTPSSVMYTNTHLPTTKQVTLCSGKPKVFLGEAGDGVLSVRSMSSSLSRFPSLGKPHTGTHYRLPRFIHRPDFDGGPQGFPTPLSLDKEQSLTSPLSPLILYVTITSHVTQQGNHLYWHALGKATEVWQKQAAGTGQVVSAGGPVARASLQRSATRARHPHRRHPPRPAPHLLPQLHDYSVAS